MIKVIGLTIIGAIILFSFLSMALIKVVHDQQFPRFEKPDYTVRADLRYEDLQNDYPRRLINFNSGINVLQGYIYGDDHEKGRIVVVHGLGGGADSYLPQITYFVDQGWRVFTYDATGSFASEGKSTKGFPQALIDLDAALTYISGQAEFKDLPLLLFGHSWGGYAVANILHFDHNIAGVVSVSGVNSPMEIILEQGERMMGAFIKIQRPFLWLYNRLLFGKIATFNGVDAINNSQVPVLIIHGTEDDTVLYEGSSIIARMDRITNTNVQFLSRTEPGRNGHNNLFRSDQALRYVDEINHNYSQLFNQYNGNIPYEIKQEFYFGVDRLLAQDVSDGLMDKIQIFFEEIIN